MNVLHLRICAFVALMLASSAAALAADRALTRADVVKALPRLEQLARQAIERREVPGLSIAVVYRDEVLYLKGFGVREVGKPELVDGDTVFQLASLSKPLASTVVAALVGDGTVSWDTRIADLDPQFRLSDSQVTAELTIRDLLSHRSGLWGDAGNDLETIGYDQAQILNRLRYLQPASSFRSRFTYTNFGFTEGAVAASKAAGASWETLAAAKLYTPLGMTETTSSYEEFLKRANRASLHIRVDGSWQAKIKRHPYAQAPAGGASSSARDMATWMRLQLGDGKLDGVQRVPAAALAETHQPIIARGKAPISGDPSFYGLGWGVTYGERGVQWAHSGGFSAGVRSMVELLPTQQLGIVVLSNAFPSGLPEGLAASFFDLVFDRKVSRDWVTQWNGAMDAAYGEGAIAAAIAPFKNPPSPSSPPLSFGAYAGRYSNAYVGEASVSEKEGALYLQLGPDGASGFPLQHFDRDLFLMYPLEETPALAFAVHFAIGADGQASAVTIDAFNDNGQGVLRRASR